MKVNGGTDDIEIDAEECPVLNEVNIAQTVEQEVS